MTRLAWSSRIALAALCASMMIAEPASAQRWRRTPQNLAVVNQIGSTNGAGIVQNGQGNDAAIHQIGSGNSGAIQQNGDNNTACLIQFGRNNEAAIGQNGDGHSVAVVQARGATRVLPGSVCTRGVLGVRLRN